MLYVSANTLKVKDMIPLICSEYTKDKPIRLALLVPKFTATVMTPKYPAAAIVVIENISDIRFIHLEAMFWLTSEVM